MSFPKIPQTTSEESHKTKSKKKKITTLSLFSVSLVYVCLAGWHAARQERICFSFVSISSLLIHLHFFHASTILNYTPSSTRQYSPSLRNAKKKPAKRKAPSLSLFFFVFMKTIGFNCVFGCLLFCALFDVCCSVQLMSLFIRPFLFNRYTLSAGFMLCRRGRRKVCNQL